MSKPDHDFKADTEIRFHLSIGYVGGNHSEIFELGELLSLDDTALENMTRREVEEQIDVIMQDWSSNYIDMGWGVDDG